MNLLHLWADADIRRVFVRVLGPLAGAGLLAAACARVGGNAAAVGVLLCGLAAWMWAFAALYGYFRGRDRAVQAATARIQAFVAGDRTARIACDEEGQLCRLFHEVNALACILNAQVEQADRAKAFMKQTLSDISHQLKTPLSALYIYNGLMQAGDGTAADLRTFATLSEQELDRMQTLVQNLLKIARLDAGAIQLETAEEPLTELMDELERRFAHRAAREHKTLSFSGDEGATLVCDRAWLLDAVGNLVKNSLDYTPAGGAVQVRWRACAQMVQLTVRDTGRGIHPADLPHVCKRFYRSRFSQDTSGAGLGLPLAKAIVEAHGGTLEIDSAPGTGTTIILNFCIPTKL